MIFHFRLFQEKTNENIFQQMQKTAILAHFGPIFLISGKKQNLTEFSLKFSSFTSFFFFF